MYLTHEQQKEIAVKRLNQLDVFEPYVEAFEKKGTVTMFERFGGYWATKENGEEELEARIKAFEQETGSMVYAVTHEIFEFGECYSFLIVSKYAEDEQEDYLESDSEGIYYPFAWIWNKTFEEYSEYGSIGVQAMFGGLRRVY